MPLSHIVSELGLRIRHDGDAWRATSEVTPELCFPGTAAVRTSVIATWADVLLGMVAARVVGPRIPLTLDLEVQVYAPLLVGTEVASVATLVKTGRTIVVGDVRFQDARSGTPLAVSHLTFMTSPNPAHVFPDDLPLPEPGPPLSVPLVERVGRTVVEPGTVLVPRRLDGLNASGAIQGGLVAFAAEEAVVSLKEDPTVLTALSIRYLRAFGVGPARATAEPHGDLAVVQLTDQGRDDRIGAIATARRDSVGSHG